MEDLDPKEHDFNDEAEENDEALVHQVHVDGMFENWFLEYASYVILERAIPAVEDGLKPVQRRILHAMKELDDGRFNKVANVIGSTMQFHPHGDAAIGDAITNLGQKELLIECQGNWGDTRTGDSAAAPRYIEARLSKFALDVAFNNKTTDWQMSYDGRKREPINLPVKFPLLLAQGVEGIAVGLATKIMPHNFNELIKGSIDILKGRSPKIYPDFINGGSMDISNYNDGLKGGKLRVRAKIDVVDKKTLAITEIPYGVTTSSLIDSILKANDNNKIKIKNISDNTAKDVEIIINLPSGTSPNVTLDALYAFTDCEVSISPNACVVTNQKPQFIGVVEVLRLSTERTVQLLKLELEIKKGELLDKWHYSSLERIFIENRIYRDIEECETWEGVLETIDKGLGPHKKKLKREVTRDDIVRLTEIKIKRISKFDSFKANEEIKNIDLGLKEVDGHLGKLTDFAIDYFKGLLEKYGKGRERKTEIQTFDVVSRKNVVIANQKLYVNRKDGFIGYGLKRDEFVSECSDIDDVIIFRKDGKFLVTKISEKSYVGKNIIHVQVWKKGDDRMVYHMIYADPKLGKTFVKRFNVTSITRDREYDLTTGNDNCKLLHFSANKNSESEVVTIQLTPASKARSKIFDYDFGDLSIKGRGSKGNTLTKYAVKKVVFKSRGSSTMGGRDLWLDESIGRLNLDSRGRFLGNFKNDDLVLAVYDDGSYELTKFDLSNRYKCNEIKSIEKFDSEKIISVIYYDGKNKSSYVKRFSVETKTTGIRNLFISDAWGSKLYIATTNSNPIVEFSYIKSKGAKKSTKEINLDEFVDVKGWKALGNKLGSFYRVSAFKEIISEEPEILEVIPPEDVEDLEVLDKNAKESEQKLKNKDHELEVGTEIEFSVENKNDEDQNDEPQLDLF
jgi:topoisomerase-4 subunit A